MYVIVDRLNIIVGCLYISVSKPSRCVVQMEVGLCVPHIVLTGGNVTIPNFKRRYEREVRPYVASHWSDTFQVSIMIRLVGLRIKWYR